MPLIKKIAVNLLLLGLSLLIAALIGEAALRLTIKDSIVLYPRYHTNAQYGEFEIRRFRPDSEFWHRSVDGQWRFEINDRGLRNSRNFSYAKSPGTVRILALGDSHTAGYEVAQTESFAAVLEQLYDETNQSVEVINAGISGFGTAEQLVFLENEGLKYHPDIVVLAFYANDFEDNVKSGIFSLRDDELNLEKTTHLPGVRIQNVMYDVGLIRWLSENSYFYSFMFNSLYEVAKESLAAARREEAQTEYAIPTGDFNEYEHNLAEELIRAIAQICNDNQTEFVIVDIPRPTELNEIRSSIPDELLSAFESTSDILVHSTESLASVVETGDLVHVPHGHRHISAASHAAIARALYERLTADK